MPRSWAASRSPTRSPRTSSQSTPSRSDASGKALPAGRVVRVATIVARTRAAGDCLQNEKPPSETRKEATFSVRQSLVPGPCGRDAPGSVHGAMMAVRTPAPGSGGLRAAESIQAHHRIPFELGAYLKRRRGCQADPRPFFPSPSPFLGSGPPGFFPSAFRASRARFFSSRTDLFFPAAFSSFPRAHLSSRAAIVLPERISCFPGLSSSFPSRHRTSRAVILLSEPQSSSLSRHLPL